MSDRNDNGRWVLPEGWVWASLEECAEILDRHRIPVNSEEREKRIAARPDNQLVPYYGATGQVGWIDEHIFNEELVLLGEDGAPFLERDKAVAYSIRGRSWVNNHAHVLRAIGDLAVNGYLQHYLNIVDYHEYVTGTTRLKLNQAQMRRIPIPLAPLPIQHLIVAEIEKQFTRLDAAVAALRRAKANLARYKAAVLKAAVEGRLVTARPQRSSETSEVSESASDLLARILAERRAQWEAANPKKPYIEPKGPDVAGLPGLPVGWVWATVEQVGDANEQPVLTGPFGSSLGSNDFIPQGVPLLTIGCLKESGITLDKAFYVSEEKANELERYRVREGDILFSRMAAVGRAGFVTASLEGSLINYHLMRLRLNIKAIDPDFFIYYVRGSKAVEAYIREVNHGVTRDGINTSQLLALPVALPPYSEQRVVVEEIERLLSVVHASERVIDANLARADRLRQGVLGKAFRGELVANGETSEVF